MAASPFRFRPRIAFASLLLAAFLAGAASSPVVAQGATAEAAVPYAPVKRPRVEAIRRETLGVAFPTPYPRRGVLVIFSNGLSQGATWITVDFDARRVELVHTATQTLPDGEVEVILDSKDGGALSLAEVNTVVRLANEIWNPPPRARDFHFVTDAMCNLVLLDGDTVLRTIASGDGSDPLVKAILDLKAGASARR